MPVAQFTTWSLILLVDRNELGCCQMVLLYGGGDPRRELSCVLAVLQRQADIGNALDKKHGAMVIVVTGVTAVCVLLVQAPIGGL